MLDLYAINLHLQERLESDWRDEVRAPEAARWLDKAGLLTDRKGGLPLRNLLRAGRIAGQQQRPDKKNGTWFIRRLAASRDPQAIRKARERLRRCLPIDRDVLPPDWPVNQGPAVFWQELGKTVAAFGYLEHILASTCYALLATGERRPPYSKPTTMRPCADGPGASCAPRRTACALSPANSAGFWTKPVWFPAPFARISSRASTNSGPGATHSATAHGSASMRTAPPALSISTGTTTTFPSRSSGTLTSSACPTSAPAR